MKDQDLIKQLKSLKSIKPNQEWAFSAKRDILGPEQEHTLVFGFILRHKPAFASATLFSFVAALVIASYSALPGDMLFSVRKTTESIELMAKLEKAQTIIIAQRRVEDLKKAQQRAEKNVEPAIAEVQSSISEAARIALEDPEVTQQVLDIDREVKSLGVIIQDNPELTELYQREAEAEIERIKEMSLTEEDEESLEKAIELYENEDYGEAYLLILEISS